MQSECASQAAGPVSAELENEADDGVASVTSDSVLHGPPSVADSSDSLISLRKNKRKSRSGILFRAWSFQISVKTVKIDFSPASSTAGEKRIILFEHLSLRTGHERPDSVTSFTVFCDESHFSGPTDSEGLVSLGIQGYVQSQKSVPLTKMQNWIGSASLKPVPGGLRVTMPSWPICVGMRINMIHGLSSLCLEKSGQTTRDATRRGKSER